MYTYEFKIILNVYMCDICSVIAIKKTTRHYESFNPRCNNFIIFCDGLKLPKKKKFILNIIEYNVVCIILYVLISPNVVLRSQILS